MSLVLLSLLPVLAKVVDVQFLIPVERFGTGTWSLLWHWPPSVVRLLHFPNKFTWGLHLGIQRYHHVHRAVVAAGSSGGLSPTDRAGVGAIAAGGAFGGACICTS